MGLTVVGAVLLIAGLLMVIVSEVLRLRSANGGPGVVRAGELLAACGLGIGMMLLVALTVGRAERGPGRRRRLGEASFSRRRDPAQEWLAPLSRLPSVRTAARPVPPSWPEPVQAHRLGSGDYSDDGWHPDSHDGWNPGPAYAWSPPGRDDWDRGGDEGSSPGGEEAWSPRAPAARAGDDRRSGPESSPATGPHHAYLVGHTDDLNGHRPPYLTGPQPVYAAGPEPGLVGPVPVNVRDPDAEYGYPVGPGLGSLARPTARPAIDDDTWPIPAIHGTGQPAPEPRGGEPVTAEEIKDLYTTAEAIGEDALGQHFDQLRQRQRSLIHEFFDQAGLGSEGTPAPLGGDSAPDGASLPG